MASKILTAKKKSTSNIIKQNNIKRHEVIHIGYLSVYHEVLKYEEVLDLDIDIIFETTMNVIKDKLNKGYLDSLPDKSDIRNLVNTVIDKLKG